MGEVMSTVRKLISTTEDENKKQCHETLDMLMTMGKNKLELFRKVVEGNTDSREIPIDKIVASSQLITVMTEKSAGKNIGDNVGRLIKDVCSGEWANAISGSAEFFVDSVLGSFSGSESEQKTYAVVVGPLGGITRLDFYIYAYKFTSKSMIAYAEQVLVTSMIASSVKVTEVDLSTLRVLMERAFKTLGEDASRRLLKDLQEAVENERRQVIPRMKIVSMLHPRRIHSRNLDVTDDGQKNRKRSHSPDCIEEKQKHPISTDDVECMSDKD